MKQKLKRFMAGFMAMLTLVGTLFTNGTTAFAASPQANIAFWNASVKNSGEVSELKPGYNHGKILYSILDGNSAYCMNFGLRADGGQLMNSYDDASTSMSAQQRKLLSYCLYYGFNSTQKAAPSNSQCDEYIATQAMVWVIVADIFGTGSGDSAARKLCNTAPSPDSSYSYYERLRDNISSSYNATLPSFASRRTSEAPTYELKWNEGSQRFETTLSDSNGVLSDFDFGISGYSVDKNGNSITISSTSVDTTATTGTFTSNAGKVERTSSCVFWLTGKSGYQEFIHSVDEAIKYINEFGFLPLFKNEIDGFSLEERTVPEYWWSDNPEIDPWMWRAIIARRHDIVYGKFFDKKAGFISKKWLPVFANYRRDGYDFDALYDDGKAPNKHKKIMVNFMENNADSEIYSNELKKQAGFGKDGEKGFDGAITNLMMQTYLCNYDFKKRVNKSGIEYGWDVAVYSSIEHIYGYDYVTSCYKDNPQESWKQIVDYMRKMYPEARDKQIRNILK